MSDRSKVHYVRRRLDRMSRERWIPGDVVRRAALHFARKVSANPHATAKAAYASECEIVGMLRGEPPLWHFEPGYRDLLRIVQAAPRRKRGGLIEIELLRLYSAAKPHSL